MPFFFDNVVYLHSRTITTKLYTMKYYTLKMIGYVQSWVKCDFDPNKRQIPLYTHDNNEMKQYGIGLY